MAVLLQDLLDSTIARLIPLSDTPQLDAQVLLAHSFAKPRTWLLAHTSAAPDVKSAARLEKLVRRLEKGEPLPYVLGHWEFYGLDFHITPKVLIPRPETELLVERAIAWLRPSGDESPKEPPRIVADIGTGSGCIAVSIARNLPGVCVVATDISTEAIKVAQRNARKFNVLRQIDFLACDILPERVRSFSSMRPFDLVCANLPYIPTGKLQQLPVYQREPTLALDGGPDGLDPFRKLFSLVPDWMAPGGRILLEVESTRAAAALSLAYDAFTAASFHLHRDLAGSDRLLEIKLSTE
ncbi:MAG TPA: peptide chain release factor N(5)-glutamine methyltransferase [Anaerolineales bacterium]|nr:peptide chain release factor N(5)-glutamine methyltransferase [Anaerolineales bacterium]